MIAKQHKGLKYERKAKGKAGLQMLALLAILPALYFLMQLGRKPEPPTPNQPQVTSNPLTNAGIPELAIVPTVTPMLNQHIAITSTKRPTNTPRATARVGKDIVIPLPGNNIPIKATLTALKAQREARGTVTPITRNR